MSRIVATLAALALLAACAEPTAPAASRWAPPSAGVSHDLTAAPSPEANCTFADGTNVCVYTTQVTYTSTHEATKGCLYGPTGIPSGATLTFLDTYERTITTTVSQHGLEGVVYDVSTVTSPARLLSSTLISYVCNPPA